MATAVGAHQRVLTSEVEVALAQEVLVPPDGPLGYLSVARGGGAPSRCQRSWASSCSRCSRQWLQGRLSR